MNIDWVLRWTGVFTWMGIVFFGLIAATGAVRRARRDGRLCHFFLLLVFVCFLFFVFWRCFCKKSGKTAVPEDGRPPRALVLTELVE